ncbi:hypothetical protein [Aneurinibacillus migulanus]|uniref:hypothetical protein n=1 Tax=Aneurinibacillus migulanus TaxID=47500 RepID=UPI00128E9969|nr:hypothetical protein [Aneurinibacillus migulanus]MCP1357652.1 hypothetical protein [Aneurinibacillus migulanus]
MIQKKKRLDTPCALAEERQTCLFPTALPSFLPSHHKNLSMYQISDYDKLASVRNTKIRYVTKLGEVREGLLSREFMEIDGKKFIFTIC